jgi:hypothetical protein
LRRKKAAGYFVRAATSSFSAGNDFVVRYPVRGEPRHDGISLQSNGAVCTGRGEKSGVACGA